MIQKIRLGISFVRSVNLKIINIVGSIMLANLNNTMQTNNMQRKNRSHIQIETRFTKDYFL